MLITNYEREQLKLQKEAKHRLIFFAVIIAIVTIASVVLSIIRIATGHDEVQASQGEPECITTPYEIDKAYQMPDDYDVEYITVEEIEKVLEEETRYVKFQEMMSMDWDADDAYLLAKIAMAEAEGESTECKALVILTVLNRMMSDEFPDTIHDVIYQKNQFSPITNGRWDRVEPNEDCYKALDMIYSGYDESQGCLYFEASTTGSTWHSRNLQFLFEIDSTRFYK